MVDVVSRRCEEADCRRRPLYGHEGEKGRFCSFHKVKIFFFPVCVCTISFNTVVFGRALSRSLYIHNITAGAQDATFIFARPWISPNFCCTRRRADPTELSGGMVCTSMWCVLQGTLLVWR